MSSKAISKVQDDIKNLKQLLSVNASGLQRQALAIDKLKLETAQVKTSTYTQNMCVKITGSKVSSVRCYVCTPIDMESSWKVNYSLAIWCH